MSIWTSLITGSSGLGAFGQAISVVGDNIANVSTTGYKASRAGFADVLGGTAANGQRSGGGVTMSGPELMLGRGALQQTGRALDLAIRDRGFFALRGSHNGFDGTYYSRDGRFGVDNQGYITSIDGLRLQGYAIDPTGRLSSVAGDLQLDLQSPPRGTAEAQMSANLDANSPVLGGFDPADPEATSNHSTSMTVYDSLGGAHRVTVYFAAQGNGQWEWHAMVDGGEINGGSAGTPVEIASGGLSFNPDGSLQTESPNGGSADFLNANPGQAINFDFGDAIDDGGTGFSGSTQYAASFNVTSTSQDGYAAGTPVDLLVSDEGVITARFSNGQSRDVARVAIANFRDEEGLQRMGNQIFAATTTSGEALLGAAGTDARSTVAAGTVEGSNVDLGSELVTLIAYQRAFQANARTISTADDMLAEIANLKR
jgi:flagellar hook protein FlgE